MLRRGLYISEVIPALLALGALGTALYGLLSGRVPGFAQSGFFTLVVQTQDPGLYWFSIGLYLLIGTALGIVGIRTLRGY